MDYEKKYKEALERARENFPCVNQGGQAILQDIFPELKESEDEKIRKEILDYFKDLDEHGYPTKEWTAWVEKQGEPKPVDMSIKEKAHQIAWESSKHYDPNVCKQEWCEMSALEMASWLENLQKSYKNGID